MMNQMRSAIAASALAPAHIEGLEGEQRFCFDNDFVGFDGHFPRFSILPAVLQVLMAQMVAETIIGSPVILSSLNRAKFRQQIRPGDHIDVRVSCREKENHISCKSELTVDAQPAASFSLVLSRERES